MRRRAQWVSHGQFCPRILQGRSQASGWGGGDSGIPLPPKIVKFSKFGECVTFLPLFCPVFPVLKNTFMAKMHPLTPPPPPAILKYASSRVRRGLGFAPYPNRTPVHETFKWIWFISKSGLFLVYFLFIFEINQISFKSFWHWAFIYILLTLMQ